MFGDVQVVIPAVGGANIAMAWEGRNCPRATVG